MKKNISGLVMIIAMSGLLYSCYYDKADVLYNHGAAPCDTINVISYSVTVRPILEQKCYSCHSGGASGGIAMGTYAADKILAENGKLYGTINHASGYSPMPEGEAKMDACSIIKIKKWVDAGSVNN